MSLVRKPGPRLAAEAIAIILAAAIPGVLHLVWWEIGACVVLVLLAAVWLESALGAPAPAPQHAEQTVALPPVQPETAPHVRVLQEQPPVVQPEPEPETAPVAVVHAAPPVRVGGPPYNIWELERGLAASDSADDEQTFLLQYLRDYAAADGRLPAEFDDLVRESFPALL